MKFYKQKINPIEFLQKEGCDVSHITFDPNLKKGDYNIIRQCSHDGTLLFTHILLTNTLKNLVNKSSYCKKDNNNYIDIKYKVGWLKLVTVFAKVQLPCGEQFGEKQRTRLPVKCEYIYER